jgi:alpha-1,3-rhamnosyltransferase
MSNLDMSESIKVNPLVSIIVIAYNSSQFILETLESAKVQSYYNIELIVTDDCSSDDTVEICQKWIAINKDCFVRTVLLTSEINTGIPKNCNRGLYASKGTWVKLIAGDDALMINCIKDNIDFIAKNSKVFFCFSEENCYQSIIRFQNLITESAEFSTQLLIGFSKLNSEKQLQVLARKCIVYGPTVFLNRKKLLQIRGFDISYPFIEDHPTWYNWLFMGEKIFFFPKKTVNYRVHDQSITKIKSNDKYVFSDFTIKKRKMIQELFFKHYSLLEKVLFYVEYEFYTYCNAIRKKSIFDVFLIKIWYLLVCVAIRLNSFILKSKLR